MAYGGAWILGLAVGLAAGWAIARWGVRRSDSSDAPVRLAERAVREGSGDALIVVDGDGRIIEADAATETMLPGVGSAARGTLLPEPLRLALADEGLQRHRVGIGSRRLLDVVISEPVDGALRGLLLRDVTEQQRDRRHLFRLANFDSLTGLGNRRIFLEQLAKTLTTAAREESVAALLYVDVDRFKEVNDSYGHPAGDALLKAISAVIRDVIVTWAGEQDGRRGFVSRLSGDEFAIALTGYTSDDEVARLADDLLARIAQPFQAGERTLSTTGSIGMACFPQDGRDVEDLFKASDAALYVAKHAGRGRCVRYEPVFAAPAEQSRRVEGRLRGALERGDLRLHFQPKIELEGRTTAGFEALLRWRDDELGIVGPKDFVPVAEERGLIAAIGAWCVEETCRQIRAWRDAGYETVPVSVNVSSSQFVESDLQRIVTDALVECDLEPTAIEIELTESLILEDNDATALTLRDLRSIGVRIALDDFGTGYSALTYLNRFPLDVVKMDRGFLRGIEDDASAAGIAAAVIAMSHSLGLEVVAEGVDSPGQADLLGKMDCDQIQGFLFSPAVPADRAVEFLAEAGGQRPVLDYEQGRSTLDDLLALEADGGDDGTRSGLAGPDAAEDAPRPARVLVVESEDARLGALALRMMQLGGDTSMVQNLDEASLFVLQERPEIDLMVVADGIDPGRLATLREMLAKDSESPPPLVLAIAERPSEETRVALRQASVDWLLSDPAEDHLLRFFLNAARYRGSAGAVQRSLRVPVEATTWIRAGGSRRIGTMTSLSARGAGIECDDEYTVGQSLRLEFTVDGSRLRLFGTVVDSSLIDEGDDAAGAARIGVMFFDLDPEDADRIATIIDEVWLRYRP